MKKRNNIIDFIIIVRILLLVSCGGGSSYNTIPGNDNNTDNSTDNNTGNDNQTMNFCTHGAERIQWTNGEISAFEEQSAEYFDTVRNKSSNSYPKISAFFMGAKLYKNALESNEKGNKLSHIRFAEMLARYNLVVLNIPWLDEETRKWQEKPY